MPVPKKKTSKSSRDQRRSHHALVPSGWSTCPNCGQARRSHHVCANCGHYKGRQVIAVK
ncbi:MAG: 50S ribosomal protein L32 [Calditrichaeota bacterium]|nr:50S ribosomal protein L32 [Candidatus Cloacimonadota bacterium]MCA9785268.1 50S ribosomal protein L32 [Candidatus Cloacimonadota bacterium]MCB1047544.1 50S ribosomal protein L32 [Calditrichota bacterium]MCB9473330.1 50S ribosomal protein L32 [Candidatus Delongbacteria bacterium]